MSASRPLRVTLLASEWKSSKGGLSTLNRELAIQFAKHPNVSVTFFVPKCSQTDKRVAGIHNVRVIEAEERPGYDQTDWLAFPPKDLLIDFVVGHGVVLGRPAQIIRNSHNCKWLQVVHTAPDELAMFKDYPDAIPKGEEKQWNELTLCEMADVVMAVGPKLVESYSAYLSSCGKGVHNLTPGIFTELSSSKLSTQKNKFRILVFGRGDSEDFQVKGFDIAAQAVAKLNDRSYRLTFVGAPKGSERQVANSLLGQGLSGGQLTVYGYHEDRERLTKLLCASNLAVIPSRTEGFGLTALEALSAGLPFLVSQNSGFGEAIQEIPFGTSFIVDSEDPECWAEAIKRVRQKGSERAIQECRELRTRYSEKYSWEKQCNDFVKLMLSSVYDQPRIAPLDWTVGQQIEGVNLAPVTTPYVKQGARQKEKPFSRKERAAKSHRGIRTWFSCFSIKVSEQESTDVSPCQKKGEASVETKEVKIKDDQSITFSKSKQHHVLKEIPLKDQLSSDPLKPEDVDLQHFQVIEPHLSSATDLDGKTGRKSIDIMIETQTTKEQDTQTRRDQEKDSEHHATQTDSSTSDGDAKTKRSSFDIKTKPSEGQSTKTGSEEDKDSQRPLQFQTDETRPESFEFVSPTHEKQETEEHMDTSGDYVQITDQLSSDPLKPEDVGFQHLQSIEPRLRRLQFQAIGPQGSSTVDVDDKIEINYLGNKTQTDEEQITQTRRDQENDSVDHRLQTDGTQFLRTQLIGVQQKTEEHIDTPDDLVEVQLEDVPKFSEENMDGRKRFTFPWSQKHREILKEFPRHSFDSKTNGRKFEYQPRIRLTPKRSTPTPPRAAADTVTPTNRQSSLPESFSVEDKNRDMQCHVSPSTRDQEIKSQEVSLSTVGKNMERKEFSGRCMDGRKSLMSSWNQKRGQFQEEAQRHIFGARKEGHKFEHQPKRRLPPKPSTPPPSRAAADTSKLQSSLPESPSVEDEFWDRRCHVSPDITDQEINSKDVSSSTTENAMEQKGQASVSSGFAYGSHQRCLAQTPGDHVPEPLQGNTTYGLQGQLSSTGKPIMLKSKLYKGKISYRPDDIVTQWPGFKVPQLIVQSLRKTYRDIAEAEVEIVLEPNDDYALRLSVKPKRKVEYGMINVVKQMAGSFFKESFRMVLEIHES